MTTAAGLSGHSAPLKFPERTAPASLTLWTGAVSAILLAVLAFAGGWQRRWMSDDGLIVLRTVRNLLAGNGPVFNAGERVEANTSTLWQYLIYLVALVTDARLEIIAMWLALIFTTVALGLAAWGTARLYRHRSTLLLLPAGGLVYLALPPARDFATSGLEWGLSLLWLAGLWCLLVAWAIPRKQTGRHRADRFSGQATYWLAFWAGLSWLVRPELALYGGLAGLLIIVAATSWRQRGLILAAALPVPAGYQIFRMGYYGLLTPHTAVAKSAGDAEWAGGWGYLRDLVDPYWLWLALVVVIVLAAVTLWRFTTPHGEPVVVAGRARLRTPVAVVPLVDLGRITPRCDVPAVLGLVVLAWWGMNTVIVGHPVDWETDYEELGIVDERDFWTYATFREQGDPPLVTDDFRTALAMNNYPEVAQQAREQDAGLMSQILVGTEPNEFSWITTPRIPREVAGADPTGLADQPPTAYHINLGMTSMNAPLELRVLDTVGLTTPLAARQPRDEDARVGHDKWLPLEWQAADTAIALENLPGWYDREATALARQALQTPALAELVATYREPMSLDRFLANIRFAFTGGRTLEFSLDPAEVIAEHGPVQSGIRVAWPVEILPEKLR